MQEELSNQKKQIFSLKFADSMQEDVFLQEQTKEWPTLEPELLISKMKSTIKFRDQEIDTYVFKETLSDRCEKTVQFLCQIQM